MSIWFKSPTIAQLNNQFQKAMIAQLGIEITAIQTNALLATMPVDERTKQPFGYLHGGASVVLAETLGSIASGLCVDDEKFYPVGQSIFANHMKSVCQGVVTGKATPLHLGKHSHVWQIEIVDEQQRLICNAQLTTAIIVK